MSVEDVSRLPEIAFANSAVEKRNEARSTPDPTNIGSSEINTVGRRAAFRDDKGQSPILYSRQVVDEAPRRRLLFCRIGFG